MKILVTGAAGFIGASLSRRLAEAGHDVLGIDCVNDYYSPELKYARLKENGFGLEKEGLVSFSADGEIVESRLIPGLRFAKIAIDDRESMERLFEKESFGKVVNLAAQAGVRYSITNPYSYLQSNLVGFMVLLECCRNHGVSHLVFASSSSVYGMNSKVPYSEEDRVDQPVSLYAATKKSDEMLAYSYHSLYGIRMTGLRYFTVYGPWGRPDMAPFLFADAIMSGGTIKVFNNGDMMRDFTYVDDIVEATERIVESREGRSGYEIYNVGCSDPVRLMDFISGMEKAFGREVAKEYLPMQKGDVCRTYADVSRLERDFGFRPGIGLAEGLERFAQWYMSDKNPLRK